MKNEDQENFDYQMLVVAFQTMSITDLQQSTVFNSLIEHFQDISYSYAYGLLGDVNLAQDAVQDAFVSSYLHLNQLRHPQAFPAWLRKIVHSQCIRLIRHKPLPLVPFDQIEQIGSSEFEPSGLIEQQQARQHLHLALLTLNSRDRTAILLHYLGDYPQNEVAAFLGLSLATTKKLLQRSRVRLRKNSQTTWPKHS